MTLLPRSAVFHISLTIGSIAAAQAPGGEWCQSRSGVHAKILAQAQQQTGERGSTRYVKVKVVMGSQPGPGGDACSMSEVQRDLDGLNEVFAYNNTGIQFMLCGSIQVVDSWAVYDIWNFDPSALNPYFEPGYLTIIFANSLPNSLGGFAYGDMVYVRGTGSVDILAHEVCHALGLLHTHDDILGAELVNGSNCASAGDFVCDTPAEPNLSQPGLVSALTCTYIGTLTDANGDDYSPMPRNIMSYSPCMKDTLTPGQGQLMRYVLDNVKSYLHRTTQPVIIEPFETRQCHNSGDLPLTAAPGPGIFQGPLVNGSAIVNAPNAPGQYHVSYTPDQLPEDSSTFMDQLLMIYDQYAYYTYGATDVDSAMQVIRAGADGRFTAVDFLVHNTAAEDYRLRIYSGSGVGASLIHEVVLSSPVIDDTTWISFPISEVLSVVANAVYTLEITAADTFRLMTSLGQNDPYYDYPRGLSSLGIWRDLAFRTWVHALPPCQEARRYYEIYQPPAYSVVNLASSYCPSSNELVTLLGANPGASSGSLWINGVETTQFVASLLGEGEHHVEYINTTYGCTDTTEMTFVVAEPALAINDLPPTVCLEAAPMALTGSPSGGVLTINGIVTDLLDPGALGVGTHTASYTAIAPLDTVAFRDQWCCGWSSYPYLTTVPLLSGEGFWQSFTPAFTGTLDSIRVSLVPNLQSYEYAVRILEGDGTGGNVLATDTITTTMYNSFPSLNGNMHPALLQGQLYTLEVQRIPDASATNPLLFLFTNNSYPGGASEIPGTVDADLYFEQYLSRSYVCEGTIDVPFQIEVCTGAEALSTDAFSAGPNPFSSGFTVHAANEIDYALYSSLGAVMRTGNARRNERLWVDTEDLPAGIYTLRCAVVDGSWQESNTIVKCE